MHIGIIGSGQLGRMLALAGMPLGHCFSFYGREESEGVDGLGERFIGKFSDSEKLLAFAKKVDVVTFEFENVDVDTLTLISNECRLLPPCKALAISQDRLVEKTFFLAAGAQTPAFADVASRDDLEAHVTEYGFPAVLKTRRLGYDGKGQAVLRTSADLDAAWQSLSGVGLIVEKFVRFDRELSLICVRGISGETSFYPLIANMHRAGVLERSDAPAPNVTLALQKAAEKIGENVLADLEYVGVLVIEFFQVGDDLLVNEMAPRVHNSGHGTIEGAVTSQFENHVRAVTGMPLGSTNLRGPSVMLNVLGKYPDADQVLALHNVHLHRYDKTEKPGRKIGHITVECIDGNEAAMHETARIIGEILSQPTAASS